MRLPYKFDRAVRVVPEVPEIKRREKLRAQGDDLRTSLGEFVARVTQVELPIELDFWHDWWPVTLAARWHSEEDIHGSEECH
jgi:hypothetical protein